MKATAEQIEKSADAVIAFHLGKPVQQRKVDESENDWRPLTGNLTISQAWIYRPAPVQQKRLWSSAQDIPVGVVYIRSVRSEGLSWAMIISAGTGGLNAAGDMSAIHTVYYDRISDYEYSTDRKRWHKCEVTEE